jgi:hypothetical protein
VMQTTSSVAPSANEELTGKWYSSLYDFNPH